MKVRVTKNGLTLLMLDVPTLISLVLLQGFGAAVPYPYEVTVTLADGHKQAVVVEEEREGEE